MSTTRATLELGSVVDLALAEFLESLNNIKELREGYQSYIVNSSSMCMRVGHVLTFFPPVRTLAS
jgi:hypothetical protein